MSDLSTSRGRSSTADSRSESGYNSASSSGSLSDQVGHVVDITVAALELINGSPASGADPERSGDAAVRRRSEYGQRNEEAESSSSLASGDFSHGHDDEGGVRIALMTAVASNPGTSPPSGADDIPESPGGGGACGREGHRQGGGSFIDRLNEKENLRNVRVSARKRSISSADEPNGKRSARSGPTAASATTTDNDHNQDHDDQRTANKTRCKEAPMARNSVGYVTKRGQNGAKEGITRPPAHVLPPCKVCGIQATGFHYGVNTCEACKGFFRRSIIRKEPYVCANNPAKCTIAPGKRKTCPRCRYKKCIEAGMSVDGIKIGRYTYAKRTQDIIELRQANASIQDDNGSEQDDMETESGMHVDSEDEQIQHIVEFIDTVLKANDLKDPQSPQIMALIEQIQKQVKEQYDKGQVPTRVPMDQFFSVLSSTGVQLDNRIQVLQQWVVLLNDGLKYLVNFAKMIPGFRDLKLTDQMALIKHSICEVWIIGRYMAFHKDLDYFITVNGMAIDVIKTLGEDFGSSIMKVTRRLRNLTFTKEEIIIVKALVIFFTDRCDLQDAKKVTAIRDRLIDALLYLLNQRDANMALNIGRLSAILTELRQATEMYQEYTKKLLIVSNKTGVMNFPPLLLEVMSLPDIT